MSGGSKNFLSPDFASAAGLRPLTPATGGGLKPPDTGSPNSLQPTGSATGESFIIKLVLFLNLYALPVYCDSIEVMVEA